MVFVTFLEEFVSFLFLLEGFLWVKFSESLKLRLLLFHLEIQITISFHAKSLHAKATTIKKNGDCRIAT